MTDFNFNCSYCNRAQTVTYANQDENKFPFRTTEADFGFFGLRGLAIVCANPDCRKASIMAEIITAKRNNNGDHYIPERTEILYTRRLLPDSFAKPLPDYVPEVIAEDYYEACKIRDLSPKASATLSRRCLQGMIRDFAKVDERTLYHEIEKFKSLSDAGEAPKGVSDDSIESLHHVRSLGNIGAHMERDINVVIPVDPEEAQILIELIETLIDEWYVARNKREFRFAALRQMAEEKQARKNLSSPDANSNSES